MPGVACDEVTLWALGSWGTFYSFGQLVISDEHPFNMLCFMSPNFSQHLSLGPGSSEPPIQSQAPHWHGTISAVDATLEKWRYSSTRTES